MKEYELISFSVIKSDIEKDLLSKVEPVVVSMGYQLRDIEVLGGASAPTIRVTLEASDGQPPIGIDDCSKVHHTLGPMFDVWDPFPGNYTLEVSSPGEKPPLRTMDHFQQAIGHSIKFQTVEPLPMPPPMKPRRNWGGVLKALNTEIGHVVLVDEFGEHQVPVDQIRHASWLRDWGTSKTTKNSARNVKNPKEKR